MDSNDRETLLDKDCSSADCSTFELSSYQQARLRYRTHRKTQITPTDFPRWHILAFTIGVILIVSLFLNVSFLWKLKRARNDPSIYAGLKRNSVQEIPFYSPYWSESEDEADRLWNDINVHLGFVALDNVLTDAKNLPRGEEYPWDHSKSIYVLNAYHILHCLQMFRTSINEAHHGLPQSMSYRHMQHCLNDLRADAMCNADDTPRYTRTYPSQITGADGQLRQCRDFAALESWAQEHTACFRFTHPEWNRTAQFRHCPSDSPYLATIRATYGFSDDWLPDESA